MENHDSKVAFIWSIANLLRGVYKDTQYAQIILPLTLIKRLDDVLLDSKQDVLDFLPKVADIDESSKEEALLLRSKKKFYNVSPYTLKTLLEDPDHIEDNFKSYLSGFSSDARDILENFQFNREISKLVENNLLFALIQKYSELDLSGDPLEMGNIFEELIRKFADIVNQDAGEYYTPRDIIELLVDLLFIDDHQALTQPGVIRTIYDPTCGTGGMLSTAQEKLLSLNSEADLHVFGQELMDESYAIGKADLLVKGKDPSNIRKGNTLSDDLFKDEKFHYVLANPPYGAEWKIEKEAVVREHEVLGFDGRFGAGLPAVGDGSMLFLQHMISKMKPEGSRVGVVLNGSPLFTGDAGGGPSNIRKWIIENDWLEAIIALPSDMFYNTGISTYIWILSNDKKEERQGKIQLIDASGEQFYKELQKSIGKKRKELPAEAIKNITELYDAFEESEFCKIFDNEFFGYTKVTVEQPKVVDNEIVQDRKGNPKPDASLRDEERVPLSEDIDEYFTREVEPHLPDAWMDRKKDKVGYEINFSKYFYKYKPLRSSEDVTRDLLELNKESKNLLNQIMD